MIPGLPRRGQRDGATFVVIEHDPAHPLRPQRDEVGQVLPDLLGPGAGTLRRRPGRPPVIDGAEHIGCSIAHCAGLSMLAVAPDRDLGVDLEAVRPDLPLNDVAAAFFTEKEARWLRDLPTARRPLGTILLWTAKEAWLKMSGAGIVAGLQTPALDHLDLSAQAAGATEFVARSADGVRLWIHQGSLAGAHHVMAIMSRPNAAA